MYKSIFICISICISILFFANTGFSQSNQNIRIVSYNLLNFPNGRDDCGASNVNLPNRTDTLRKIMGYLEPDIFVGCEIQTEAGCDSILSRTLNVFGSTQFQRANFVENSSGGTDLQNMLFYNSDKLVLQKQGIVRVSPRDINHYILYVIDPNLGQHLDTCFVEVFMCHLKAGSGSAEQETRAAETAILRDFIDSRPQNRHFFVCGDFNVYRSTEVGYQNLVAGPNTTLVDPINAPGTWTNNASFDYLHTQSPRTSSATDCGVTGGLDDRFDFVLASPNALDGADSLKYVVGSYQSIGNDGNHFNTNILASPTNTLFPDSVMRALFHMSDHLPVSADFEYTFPTDYGLALNYSFGGNVCQTATTDATVTPNLGLAPYSFLWDTSAGNQTTATAINLNPGNYCVVVTDANGKVDEICFQIPALPNFEVSVFPSTASGSCDGSAFVIVSGGAQPYSYSWNDASNQQTQTATNLCGGTYTCTVTDNNGCEVMAQVTIGTTSLTEIAFENQFRIAPNPFVDGFEITKLNTENNEQAELSIYSTTGEKIYFQSIVNWLNGEIQIESFSNLNQGIYVLEIRIDNELYRTRLVKM